MLMSTRAGAVVAWGNTWLRGRASLDEASVHSTGDDQMHRVVGLPGEPDPVPWSIAFSRLKRAGVTRMQLALPVAGDPLGLAGPPRFNADATAAGAAVLALLGGPGSTTGFGQAYGLVPTVADSPAGEIVRWDAQLVAAPATPLAESLDLRQAERGFGDALRSATATLEQLDVARPQAEVGQILARLDLALREMVIAPVTAPPAARLISTATRLHAMIELAVREDGAAVTADEARRRQAALRPVSAAARRAMVAAYSSVAEPTATRSWATD